MYGNTFLVVMHRSFASPGVEYSVGISFFPAGGYSCLVLETTSLDHRNIHTGFGQVLVSSISL